MRFAFWFYLCKFSVLLLPIPFVGIVFRNSWWVFDTAGVCALALLVFMGFTGAILGAFFALGLLKMKCPFCSRYVQMQGDKQRGMWLDCETCGYVHQAGFLGLRIVREKPEIPTSKSKH